MAYLTIAISQFMHALRMRHLQVIDSVLQYLKAIIRKRILFKKGGSLTMEIYIDADCVDLLIDIRSTSGYLFVLKCLQFGVVKSKV